MPVEELEKRINSRRQCRSCDIVTSTFVHKSSVCPEPGCCGDLYARNDDAIDSFRVRYSQYQELTAPLFEYYKDRGVLVTVNGAQAPDKVRESVEEIINATSSDKQVS